MASNGQIWVSSVSSSNAVLSCQIPGTGTVTYDHNVVAYTDPPTNSNLWNVGVPRYFSIASIYYPLTPSQVFYGYTTCLSGSTGQMYFSEAGSGSPFSILTGPRTGKLYELAVLDFSGTYYLAMCQGNGSNQWAIIHT